jgi:hypothetical protein
MHLRLRSSASDAYRGFDHARVREASCYTTHVIWRSKAPIDPGAFAGDLAGLDILISATSENESAVVRG